MKFRPLFFWLHLCLGLTAGLGIFFLAATGLILAFEPQIISYAESSLRTVSVPVANPSKLSLDMLAQKVKGDQADVQVTGMTVYANAYRSDSVQLGRNDTVYVDPYTGVVLGHGANDLRGFFDTVTDLHRWFGTEGPAREVAKTVKGILVSLFGLSILTGFYLWWPRHWTETVFKVIGIPQFRFLGKQREFNWHNSIGFWTAPWLLIIIVTGLIMIYPWANDLLYRVTGNQPPPRPAVGQGPEGAKGKPMTAEGGNDQKKHEHHPHQKTKLATFDSFFAAAVQADPQWISINIRMPQGNRPNVLAVVEDPASPNAYGRSLLTLNAQTGEAIKWEPYQDDNLGRKARIWVRALHTGEAGGFIGQVIAALAVMGAMLLVWTGFSLACRRFFA